MINVIRYLFCILVCAIFTIDGFAQEQPAMADLMRSNGKIYVVVAVCLIILTGLFLYVMRLDAKIKKLEKEDRNRN